MPDVLTERGNHRIKIYYSNGEKGDNNAGCQIDAQGSKKKILATLDMVRQTIEAMPIGEKEKQRVLKT